MTQRIRKAAQQQGAALYHARVIATQEESFAVSCDAGSLWTVQATGCLLRPAVGDQVLITVDGDNAYVLAVLARPAQSQAARTIELGQGVNLSVEAGVLTLVANAAQMRFASYQLHSERFELSGGQWNSVWQQHNSWTVDRFEVAVTSTRHLGDSIRTVAGHERLQARALRYEIRDDWCASARDLAMFGKERVSVDTDGDIQLG